MTPNIADQRPPPERALVAQHRMPEYDRERGSLRVLEVIEHLLADGWSVTYLTTTPPSEERYVRHLAHLGVPTIVGTDANAAQFVADLAPQLAIVAFWHIAETLIPFVRAASPTTRIIVDSVDLHFVRHIRRRSDEFDLSTPWIDELTANELRRELNTYAAADGVLTVSDDEAALIETFSCGSLIVRAVPLAERVARSTVPVGSRSGIVFVGNFRHLPNVEAVTYLCREVAPRLDPRLLREHPVTIVGNEMDERVRAAADLAGVRLVGWVPDVVPYLQHARVAVAPLLHGAGVKGKVLQSLMAGTPTVVTPLALEGTRLRGGEHLLVGDSASALADAISVLLTDADEWTRLADAGFHAVAADHAVDVVRHRFAAAIADVLAAPIQHGRDTDSRRWANTYSRVRSDVAAVIAGLDGDDAGVLVISGGDDDLVAQPGRATSHFPVDGDGYHAANPADGDAAVAMLERAGDAGARHLVVPSTSYWWLHSYPELAAHLAQHWQLVAERDEARVWTARPAAPTAAASVLVVADAAASDEHRLTVVAELPQSGLEGYDRIVMAAGRRLDARWLDGVLAHQEDLDLDVAQAAADTASVRLPPAAVRQRGIRARRTRAVTTALPVVFARRAFALLRRALSGRLVDGSATGLRFGVIDDCTAAGTEDGLVVAERNDIEPAHAWSSLDVSTDGSSWHGLAPAVGDKRLSVVIATYNRAELLAQCLDSLSTQSLQPDDWEVVVVDDGSSDATPETLRRFSDVLPLRAMRIDHAGRSGAKNAGILAAVGEIVLMLDDDDVADPDLLLEHVKAHADEPDMTVAVLGYTDWDARVDVSPLMRFVTEGATMLFAYHEIADGDRVGWRYFWEGRLSCKRALLVEHGLHDPRLAYTIDIELGYRLAHGPGLTVVHRRAAVSHMVRQMTYDEFLARAEAKGRAQHQFALLHPDPEVRAYCHIDTAQHEWALAAATFDDDRRRIGEIEAVVAEQPELLAELHQLYLRTLRGANRRGVLDAAREQPLAPLLSIVIPVWSVTPELADMAVRTVDRIWEVSELPTEVIVIDNGSPHKRPLAATVLVENDTNEGVAPAWNTGVAVATGTTIVVLNSDVHVEPGWDTALYAAANDGRRIAFPYTDHGDGLGARRPDQAGTAGWCFAGTRALFDEIGTFDESFRPAFFEDADYWTRAHAAGVDLTPVPAAVVRHVRRTTARHHEAMDLLFQAHRMKYSWKYGLDPTAPPPYWHRTIVEHQ